MSRRVNLPGADELFRATAKSTPEQSTEQPDEPTDSGRVKHDEKMTVYLTSEELMAVEQARLALRGEIGRKVDRGRFVRAAIAVALSDLDARGASSDVARRLSEA